MQKHPAVIRAEHKVVHLADKALVVLRKHALVASVVAFGTGLTLGAIGGYFARSD